MTRVPPTRPPEPPPAVASPIPRELEHVFRLSPGVIGILSDWTARYTDFWTCVRSTILPPGTLFHDAIGTTITHGWNDIVQSMLERDPADGGEWLWMLGDDHAWEPGLLVSLLEHDKDIVVPTVLQKGPPFHPVLYSDRLHNGRYRGLILEEHPDGGLAQVEAAGSAGMLIRRRVFETMPPPWFELGQTQSDETGEDIHFCRKARDLGFEIWADLDMPMGHITSAVVYPRRRDDGGWGVDVHIGRENLIHLRRVREQTPVAAPA